MEHTISKFIVGEYGTPMQVGQAIYEDLSTFFTNFGVVES